MQPRIIQSETLRAAPPAGERGIALILALLVLTILIVLVTQFAWSAKVEKTIARNAKDETKMYFAARSSLAYARAWLRADRAAGGKADSLREDWADSSIRTIQVGDVGVNVTIEDTERFLNVNLCYDPNAREFAVGVMKRLGRRLALEKGDELAERIADFIDQDGQGEQESGARNLPLVHAQELLGMVGADKSRPGFDEGIYQALVGTPADPYAGTEAVRGILEFLTASGSKKVNINTAVADPLVWALLPDKKANGQDLTDEVKDTAIQKIEEFRTGADATGASTGASASSGTSAGGTTTESGGPGTEKPGQDFVSVDELQSKIPELAGILVNAVTATASPTPGTTPSAPRPGLPRAYLSVTSQDFRLNVDASRAGMTKSFEVVLRRGRNQFDVLIWREKPATSALANQSLGLSSP